MIPARSTLATADWARVHRGLTTLGRFVSRIDAGGPDGCWLWAGSRDDAGYGRMKVAGGWHRAHRLAYELFVAPIPAGLVIDHLCRTPGCVRPEHLEAVTQQVNVLRGESPSSRTARTGVCRRGHALTPENTYLHRHARQCRTCWNASRRARYAAVQGAAR